MTCLSLLTLYLLITSINSDISADDETSGDDSTLARLVKLFSVPGAFKRVDEILGENSIEQSPTFWCPEGDEGLDCRRAAARRSVDCPTGDCYCYSCADAGPEMWAPCCRESSKCCSHLAAACRNCDHPVLIPFCSENFKKCSNQLQESSNKTSTAWSTS